jgi:hypothetical protein
MESRRSTLTAQRAWAAGGFSFLLGRCDEFGGGGGGALLGAPFLFYVLGALGDFVIDRFDFPGKVKIFRIPCVGLEE